MPAQKKISSFFLFVLIAMLLEWVGHILTMTSVHDWYPMLQKSSWNPPPYVFGPVWTVLYWMIGIAGWRVYISPFSKNEKYKAFTAYGIQFAFNVLWSFCFFFLRSPLWGFVDIVFLLVAILFTVRFFYRIDKAGGLLLIPYFAWTFFAAVLNFTIWRLN